MGRGAEALTGITFFLKEETLCHSGVGVGGVWSPSCLPGHAVLIRVRYAQEGRGGGFRGTRSEIDRSVVSVGGFTYCQSGLRTCWMG